MYSCAKHEGINLYYTEQNNRGSASTGRGNVNSACTRGDVNRGDVSELDLQLA